MSPDTSPSDGRVLQSVEGFCISIAPAGEDRRGVAGGDHEPTMVRTAAGRTLTMWARRRQGVVVGAGGPSASGTYVMGDPQDADPAGDAYLGHGVLLIVDPQSGGICVRTSLTGFPPVFLYQDRERTVVASTVALIASTPGVHLRFDPNGLVELAAIGSPIKHRTLFRDVSVVPAGVGLAIEVLGGARVVDQWRPPPAERFATTGDYIAAQGEAMAAAVQRMDLAGSFLSLTAGLDTRTILALLMREGRVLPAFTMSGATRSIDARRAEALCHAYRMPHVLVRLDESFVRQVPVDAVEASRRSGGLVSVTQAFESYFYRSLGQRYSARLSGNLGNQVGRSGTEGARMRGVPMGVLSDDVRDHAEQLSQEHWFGAISGSDGELGPLALIQQESLFASMANFCIGASYVTQQSPYADRDVILNKLREPLAHRGDRYTAVGVRVRDLKHRFLGAPVGTSFQRDIVARTGGPVATEPINWGWRPAGGVSVGGVTLGILALTDVIISTRLPRGGVPARVSRALGINGLSGFQGTDLLQEPTIRDFIRDSVASGLERASSVLDAAVVQRALATGFGDHMARAIQLFALDVVLAQRTLGVST